MYLHDILRKKSEKGENHLKANKIVTRPLDYLGELF